MKLRVGTGGHSVTISMCFMCYRNHPAGAPLAEFFLHVHFGTCTGDLGQTWWDFLGNNKTVKFCRENVLLWICHLHLVPQHVPKYQTLEIKCHNILGVASSLYPGFRWNENLTFFTHSCNRICTEYVTSPHPEIIGLRVTHFYVFWCGMSHSDTC